MGRSEMSLARFFDSIDEATRELVVLDRDAPDPLFALLESAFENQPVGVTERTVDAVLEEVAEDGMIDDAAANTVVLLKDGEIVAATPLEELYRCLLAVNSDIFVTGSRSLGDVELPAVLRRLNDTRFDLRGFPASDKEKLLLVTLSRYIERVAWETDAGTLRSSFQRLSRIEDERGTKIVYETLAETDVDVHVYGVADPAFTFDVPGPVAVHAGSGEEYRDSWFVVHVPPPGEPDAEHVALVALESEPNRWEGFWTFRPGLVEEIDAYIRYEL